LDTHAVKENGKRKKAKSENFGGGMEDGLHGLHLFAASLDRP
jgi:hypothetical protein